MYTLVNTFGATDRQFCNVKTITFMPVENDRVQIAAANSSTTKLRLTNKKAARALYRKLIKAGWYLKR